MKLFDTSGKIVEVSFTLPTSEKRVEYEFQQLGIEMEPVYGKRVWALFYKYNLEKIKDAVKIAQKRGNTSYAYLVGIIKRLT